MEFSFDASNVCGRIMPRFIRANQQPEGEDESFASDQEHAELVARVQAYAAPLTPDPDSPLSPREQLVKGVTRPGGPAQPRRRVRYGSSR
jgi:hypothetical protein